MREVSVNQLPIPVVVSKLKTDLTNLIVSYQQQGLPNFIIEGAMSSILMEIVKAAEIETEAGYADLINKLEEAASSPNEESKG